MTKAEDDYTIVIFITKKLMLLLTKEKEFKLIAHRMNQPLMKIKIGIFFIIFAKILPSDWQDLLLIVEIECLIYCFNIIIIYSIRSRYINSVELS